MKINEAGKTTVSFSELNAFAMCPLKYKKRYIDGLSSSFTSQNLFYGTALHQIIEEIIKAGKSDPDYLNSLMIDADQFFAEKEQKLPPPALLEWNRDYWLASLKSQISDFVNQVLPGISIEKSETEIALTADIGENYAIHGYADLVELDSAGRAKVVDWKTTGSYVNGWKTDHRLQGLFYVLGCWDGKSEIPSVDFVYFKKPRLTKKDKARFDDKDFVQKKINSIKTQVKTLSMQPTEKDLEWAKMQALAMTKCIEAGVFPPTGAMSEKWFKPACKWCDFGNQEHNRDLAKRDKNYCVCEYSHFEI